MAIFRVNHKEKGNFTQISNALILDTRVSEKAKMQLIVMLSRPDAWRFNMDGLLTLLHGGLSALQSGIDELVKFGYLRRVKKHINGRFEWDYSIIENPTGEQDSKSESTESEQNSEKDSKPENAEISEKNNKQKNYSLNFNSKKTASYNNTDSINTENNNTNALQRERKKTASENKQKFGRYENIPLTLEEYNKLIESYGKEQTDKSIESMSEYMYIHNKHYPRVYARLDLWIRQDIEKSKQNSNQKQQKNRFKHNDESFNVDDYKIFINDFEVI